MLCPHCGKHMLFAHKYCSRCGTELPGFASAHPVCPRCGQTVPHGAAFCRACGANLVQQPVPITECPSCGRPLSPHALFCSGCGARVRDRIPALSPRPNKAPLYILIGAAAFLVVVGLAVAAILVGSDLARSLNAVPTHTASPTPALPSDTPQPTSTPQLSAAQRIARAGELFNAAKSKRDADPEAALQDAFLARNLHPSEEIKGFIRECRETIIAKHDVESDGKHLYAIDSAEHNLGVDNAVSPFIMWPPENGAEDPKCGIGLGCYHKEAINPDGFWLKGKEKFYAFPFDPSLQYTDRLDGVIFEAITAELKEKDRATIRKILGDPEVHLQVSGTTGVRNSDYVLTNEQRRDILIVLDCYDAIMPDPNYQSAQDGEASTPGASPSASPRIMEADEKLASAQQKLDSDPKGALKDALDAWALQPSEEISGFILTCRKEILSAYDFDTSAEGDVNFYNPHDFITHNNHTNHFLWAYIGLPEDDYGPYCRLAVGLAGEKAVTPERFILRGGDARFDMPIDSADLMVDEEDGFVYESIDIMVDAQTIEELRAVLNSSSVRLEVVGKRNPSYQLTSDQRRDLITMLDYYEALLPDGMGTGEGDENPPIGSGPLVMALPCPPC